MPDSDLVELIGLLVPVTFFVMLVIERWRPARSCPERRAWTGLGVGRGNRGANATPLPAARA